MIVGIKDRFKMIGMLILSACAVFVCTLFLHYNLDLSGIEDQITAETARAMYDAQVMTGTVASAASGGCLLLTTAVMLCFTIKRYIDAHKKELGILKAMGYSAFRIAGGFWVFGFNVLVGSALGFLGAHLLIPEFYAVQNKDNLLPEVTHNAQPLLLLCLVILPTAVFSAISVFYGYLKLKTPVLELLKGKSPVKVRAAKKESDLPFLRELRRSTVRQKKSTVFFIAFAAFCYSAMTQMSIGMEELADRMISLMALLIGIVLAFVTLFLAVTTVVRSNAKAVSVMRVFGYSSRECAGAVLNGYRPAAYLGFAVGSVYQYALLKIVVEVVFREIENVPEFHFNTTAFVISLISFAVVYETVTAVYSRRVGKISVKEIMLESEE